MYTVQKNSRINIALKESNHIPHHLREEHDAVIFLPFDLFLNNYQLSTRYCSVNTSR
jgi:hypothetical protein